jgi:hypothetical protein
MVCFSLFSLIQKLTFLKKITAICWNRALVQRFGGLFPFRYRRLTGIAQIILHGEGAFREDAARIPCELAGTTAGREGRRAGGAGPKFSHLLYFFLAFHDIFV